MKSLCEICGLSNAAYKRQDGVYVVLITSLKNWANFLVIFLLRYIKSISNNKRILNKKDFLKETNLVVLLPQISCLIDNFVI